KCLDTHVDHVSFQGLPHADFGRARRNAENGAVRHGNDDGSEPFLPKAGQANIAPKNTVCSGDPEASLAIRETVDLRRSTMSNGPQEIRHESDALFDRADLILERLSLYRAGCHGG